MRERGTIAEHLDTAHGVDIDEYGNCEGKTNLNVFGDEDPGGNEPVGTGAITMVYEIFLYNVHLWQVKLPLLPMPLDTCDIVGFESIPAAVKCT